MSVILSVQEAWRQEMNNVETIGKALSYSQSAMVKGIINRTLIVEWGTIKAVVGKGVVEVLLAVTDRPENTTIVTCTLVSPCSASVALDIIPNVGDKVLVLSPRRFDVDMFDVTENTEVIENPDFSGYNNLSCIAILFNQVRGGTYKNVITFDGGNLTVQLAYSSSDDAPLLSIITNEEGQITVANKFGTVVMDKDGYVSYERKQDDTVKSKLSFTANGFSMQDENGNTIVSSKSGNDKIITINGQLKVKR